MIDNTSIYPPQIKSFDKIDLDRDWLCREVIEQMNYTLKILCGINPVSSAERITESNLSLKAS